MILLNTLRSVKRLRFLLPILFLFLGTARQAHAQGCNGVPTSTPDKVTWSPQWCQEFNATVAGPPDTTAWSFDLGGGGWGNNEVEVYCGPPGYPNNPSQCPTMFSTTTNTVYLDGSGHLVIQPINNGTWISTRMKTQGIKNFQYGRIEASIQLPDTTNQGPIHTAITGGNGKGGSYTFRSGQQANTAFHTYGVIWSANLMQFYVDTPTNPFFIVTPSDLSSSDSWPFNASIFLITNVAVGGPWEAPRPT